MTGTSCTVFYNNAVVSIYIGSTGNEITGGNVSDAVNTIAILPDNISLKERFNQAGRATVAIMNSAWVPTGAVFEINLIAKNIMGRASESVSNATIVHNMVFPRFMFDIG